LIVLPVAGLIDVIAISHLSLFDFSLEQRLCESTATAAGKPAFPVKSNFMAFALFGFHIEVTPLLRTPSTDG
jgi:hypothetical protein